LINLQTFGQYVAEHSISVGVEGMNMQR